MSHQADQKSKEKTDTAEISDAANKGITQTNAGNLSAAVRWNPTRCC